MILGSLSGVSTSTSVNTWFTTLEKPFFNPPNWVFGPVWTILYIMMGIAAGRVWALGTETAGVKKALVLFTAQLLLNFLWSLLFFGMKSIGVALIDIVLMWIVIVLTMHAFKPLDKMAYRLMWPYLIWVSFATALNVGILYLNM
jgi:translocator protein